MMTRDPYDVAVAFDDVYGGVEPQAFDVLGAARSILQRARARRLVSPMRVVGASYDPTYRTFDFGDVVYQMIGDDSIADAPIFSDLQKRFAAALPDPKHVRVDDERSYAEFRDARRAPYVAKLEARLAALEAAVADHTADQHGGGRVAALERAFADHLSRYHQVSDILGEEVERAAEKVPSGGSSFALPIPQCETGQIECWQDGAEILCTVRLPGPDGRLCMATAGTQVPQVLDEVVGCADEAGVEPEGLIGLVVPMSQVLGASALVSEICCAGTELISCCGKGPFVGVLSSKSDPALAAAMALLQRSQQGDRHARAEAELLAQAHSDLFGTARDRLLSGQREKARLR